MSANYTHLLGLFFWHKSMALPTEFRTGAPALFIYALFSSVVRGFICLYITCVLGKHQTDEKQLIAVATRISLVISIFSSFFFKGNNAYKTDGHTRKKFRRQKIKEYTICLAWISERSFFNELPFKM